jgi:hypothetical protein
VARLERPIGEWTETEQTPTPSATIHDTLPARPKGRQRFEEGAMAEAVTRAELLNAFDTAVDPQAEFRASDVAALNVSAFSGSAKDFFCANWEMIKQVLTFLGDTLGGLPKLAIKGLIAAGDILHSKIC